MKTMLGFVVSMFFLVSCKKEPVNLTTPGTMVGSVDVVLKKAETANGSFSENSAGLKGAGRATLSSGDIPEKPVILKSQVQVMLTSGDIHTDPPVKY